MAATRLSARLDRFWILLAVAIGRREQTVDDAMEFLPWRLAIALIAHDDRIAGVEFFVEHVSAGEFRADQVPDQLVKLVARGRRHARRAPPALEPVRKLWLGEKIEACRHLQRC